MDEFLAEGCHRRSCAASATVRWTVMRKVLLSLSLSLACQCSFAQAMYRMKPLGYLGGCTTSAPFAYGLNGSDQVTGQACNVNGDLHAFLWRNDGTPMVDLGPDQVGSTSTGYAINASGLVAGTAQDNTGEFGFVSSGDGAPMTRILNVWGGTYIQAFALNNSGHVTGSASKAGDYGPHAFLWKNDGSPMLELVPLDYFYGEYGEAINDSGLIAGTAYDGDRGNYLFFWNNDGTPMTDMGGGARNGVCCINSSGEVAGSFSYSGYSHYHAFLSGKNGIGLQDLGSLKVGTMSYGNALNEAGQVAGYSTTTTAYRSNLWHAVVWMNDGTPMKDLKTFGGKRSQANDINASGHVTGWAAITGDIANHAFLWRNDGTNIQDVNTLIDPMDPLKPYVTLTNGEFINDNGDILAQGTDSRTAVSDLYLLQGTVLTLAPRLLAFGNQKIATSSAAKLVTMTNTRAAAVPITSVALTGTAAGQFSQKNNCGKSLAGHATCTIKVTFRPTTKGAKPATLNVNGGGGGLRTVTLTGTGT